MLQKYDDSNPANQIELTSRFVWSHPAHMIATFFGAGLPSKAPGTYGSLAGALSFIVLSPAMTTAAWVILSIALFIAGAWAAGKVAADLGVEDHKGVVVDEVVGIWLLFAFLPAGTLWWVAGFAAFRFFDIMKLPPRIVSPGEGIRSVFTTKSVLALPITTIFPINRTNRLVSKVSGSNAPHPACGQPRSSCRKTAVQLQRKRLCKFCKSKNEK